ncbi:MAG: thiamine-monophosphate kinase [Candidatus Aminicenantales bacterium]
MKEMEEILENKLINSWINHFARSSRQINKPHEADAELLEIEGQNNSWLAVTIDTVSEEIAQGVYRDAFTMGWMVVMANFSDLAAVGAQPLGIVISVSLNPAQGEEFKEELAAGAAAACQELGVFCLGGDTNTARDISLTGCAFGLVNRQQKITRLGCQPGDAVFVSGRIGAGNALGLVRLGGLPEALFPEKKYRPQARLKEGLLVRKYGSCCMDSSDGLLFALDQLSRLNNLGFEIEAYWEQILDPQVFNLCQKTQIPPWFMAAGIHGEFELVFTIPPQKIHPFLQRAAQASFKPLRIGSVQKEPGLTITLSSGKRASVDLAALRNLWASPEIDLKSCLFQYHAWGKKWGLE